MCSTLSINFVGLAVIFNLSVKKFCKRDSCNKPDGRIIIIGKLVNSCFGKTAFQGRLQKAGNLFDRVQILPSVRTISWLKYSACITNVLQKKNHFLQKMDGWISFHNFNYPPNQNLRVNKKNNHTNSNQVLCASGVWTKRQALRRVRYARANPS